MEHRHEEVRIKSFLNNLDVKNKNGSKIYFINENYQRGYVWNRKDIKQELIVSIFKSYPIGTIIIWDKEEKKKEIVDGQQRIYTIYDFFSNEFSLNKKFKDKIIENKKVKNKLNEIITKKNNYLFTQNEKQQEIEISKAKEMLSENKLTLYFKDLPQEIIDVFYYDFNLSITWVKGENKEISEYFVVLQNQEKLKAGEILNALDGQKLYNLFPKNEFIAKFSSLFNFKNTRQDLVKFLAFMILINQNKISLGATDRNLIEKMTEFEIESLNEDEDFYEKILKLNEEIMSIKDDKKIFKKQTTKNALKIFLISYFYSNSEIYNNLNLSKKMEISRKIADLTKKFKSQSEEENNKLKEKYWKNIQEIEKILVRSHNKKKVKKITNNNFDKLFEDDTFKYTYLN